MRLAIVIIGMLILSGCATTTPRKPTESSSSLSKRWHAYAKAHINREDNGISKSEIKNPDIDSLDQLLDSIMRAVIGASASFTSLAEREHFTSSFGRSMLGKPSRVYKQITSESIYDNAKVIMSRKGLDLPIIDKESGFLLGVLDKGVVREFLFWKWAQKQYVAFVILPIVGSNNQTRFHYLSWIEEKPPLSSEFVEVELSDEAVDLIKAMIVDLDHAVQKQGGKI